MFIKDQIVDVSTYEISFHDELVIRNLNGNLELYNIASQNKKIIFGSNSENLTFRYDQIILISKRKEAQVPVGYDLIEYNTLTSSSNIFIKDVFPLFLIGSKLMLKEYGVLKGGIFLIDLSSKKITWRINFEFRPKLLSNEIIFGFSGRNKAKILALSSIDGSNLWSYDVSDSGYWIGYDGNSNTHQISRILGTYKEQLYIYLNSGKILVLNIETGEKIIVISNDKHPRFGNFGNSIELDTENSKLIQLANQDLIEVDLESFEVSLISINDMKSLNIQNYSNIVFDNEFIYFTDQDHYTLGALNRTTLEIDWTYEFAQDSVGCDDSPRYGRELKLREGRLYVLDNKNTLHIFEREINPSI